MILNNFNVDKSYFEDKYGIGIKDRRQGMALARPDSFTRSDGGRDFFD
jgi:hypothetical protein